MTLESQVCSLELAKKLKELGVKQEGALFGWYVPKDDEAYVSARSFRAVASAFTVAELGIISRQNTPAWDEKKKRWIGFPVTQEVYNELVKQKKPITVIELQKVKTEADARAKWLHYLIENKLISL